MHLSSRTPARLLTCGALAAASLSALAPAGASARTPADRATYVSSGGYAADLKAAIDPVKQWIVRRAAATARQTDACTAAGFPAGPNDPGPSVNADYSVLPPEPAAPAASVSSATATKATVRTRTRAATTARARVTKLTKRERAAAKALKAARAQNRVQAKALRRVQTQLKAIRRLLASARTQLATALKALAAAKAALAKTPTNTTPPTSTPPPATPAPPEIYDDGPPPATPTITREDCARVPKLALGLDLDETAFSNYLVGTPQADYDDIFSIRNQALGTSVALAPVLDLYKLARQYDVSVFIITARYDPILADPSNRALYDAGALCAPPYDAIGLCGVDLTTYNYRQVTLDNIHAAGYTDIAGLYMRPANGTDKGEVKAAQRAELEQRRGYDVIAMVGDNGSDIADGWEDKGFQIPTLD